MNLLNSASEFFSWCLTQQSTPHAYRETLRRVCQIMEIARRSLEEGDWIGVELEERTITQLGEVSECLLDGSLTFSELPGAVRAVVESLTSTNPKAKIIALGTEVEYHYCLNASEHALEVKGALEEIYKRTCQMTTPFQLEVIARVLHKISSSLLPPAQATQLLKGTIELIN